MDQDWPSYDESKMTDAEKEIAVQINGKLKTTVIIPTDAEDETIMEIVLSNSKIQRLMDGMVLQKRIIVKNKLVNLILKPQQ